MSGLRYRDPVAEQNSDGEWVAWLHDNRTVGIFATEAEAWAALAAVQP